MHGVALSDIVPPPGSPLLGSLSIANGGHQPFARLAADRTTLLVGFATQGRFQRFFHYFLTKPQVRIEGILRLALVIMVQLIRGDIELFGFLSHVNIQVALVLTFLLSGGAI